MNEKKRDIYVLALYDGQEIFSDFGPRASGTVEGYVYDDGGNPVSGVKVKSIYMATTDASGFYRMNDVGMGPVYSFYTSQYGSSPVLITVGGEIQHVDINGPGCVVTGTLYDWKGQFRPNTVMQLKVKGNTSTATSNATGQFVFNDVKTGSAFFSLETEESIYKNFFILKSNSTTMVDPQISPPYPEYCGSNEWVK